MYNNLLIYRNELKMRSIPKYRTVGIVVELILSKVIFKHNAEIIPFLKDVFSMECKNYVIKSRTLIVSKVCREIEQIENLSNINKKLYKFVCGQIQLIQENSVLKKKNDFDGWID